MIDGLTGDQRFFLGYAQSRRESTREATLRNLIAADGHSPGRWRAETVRNLDAWYARLQRPAGPAAVPRARGPGQDLVAPSPSQRASA